MDNPVVSVTVATMVPASEDPHKIKHVLDPTELEQEACSASLLVSGTKNGITALSYRLSPNSNVESMSAEKLIESLELGAKSIAKIIEVSQEKLESQNTENGQPQFRSFSLFSSATSPKHPSLNGFFFSKIARKHPFQSRAQGNNDRTRGKHD